MITREEVLARAHEATQKFNELSELCARPLGALPYEDLVALKRQKHVAELAYAQAHGRFTEAKELFERQENEARNGPQGPSVA